MTKDDGLADILLRRAVRGAKNSRPKAARDLLRQVAGRLRRGEPLPAEVSAFLAEAFEKAADGIPPGKALGLTGKRGRPSEPELRDRDLFLAMAVGLAMEQSGFSYEDAILRIAENWHCSEGTVRKAYSANRSFAKAYAASSSSDSN